MVKTLPSRVTTRLCSPPLPIPYAMEAFMATRRWAKAAVTGVAAIAATLVTAPATHAAPPNLKLVAVKESLLAKHLWYEQTYHGHPVVGGFYAEHVDKRSGTTTVTDGRASISGLARPSATVGAD